ncbi:uncharacterized protein TRIADDRAFT_55727 [Trichoplax adhaerens]|uniref:Uncharacterized protein n=1 Tax=Trichoplax adhaerens TaxID=10228 RepID=B3RVP6_TRIAD|nr:hypothetical protein TRIADDRAFT_55727 [Trichoplax adhaerens]EDV25536.1 hypothetical protein TRIADDRAFT_55727 [Trichoplax adhaerens]|eukprot:XP_002111569.1 hypothetical protein TRIADDRAFT_55727 [Trichoplax adhaerens]
MAAGSSFLPYQGKLLVESGPFQNTDEYIAKRIEEHTFNYGVEVVIPGIDTLPPLISDWFTSTSNCHYFAHLPVHKFIDLDFINNVIRKGKFTALSCSHVDTGDSIAIIPTVVQIDLRDPAIKSGSKLYNRINWCLTTNFDIKFNFLMSWIPDHDNQFRLESWLEGHKYSIKQCSSIRKHHENLSVPEITWSYPQGFVDGVEDKSCNISNFYEWLGALSCDIDSSVGSPDNFISTYTCPIPNFTVSNSITSRCLGFISTNQINNLVQDIRNRISWPEDIPWITVNVWGFHDSPVSWKGFEHNYFVCGDNNYTIVIFPGTSTIWYIFATSAYDSYS